MPCAACQRQEDDLLTVKAPPPAEFESEMFALGCNDEATFFCNEALAMFWGQKMDEAMRMKTAGSGRMAAGNSSDLFSAGLIRVPKDRLPAFREYLLQRGADAKLLDSALTGKEFLEMHLDPYGPMNCDSEVVDWRKFQPICADEYTAVALGIQEKHSIAEINAFGGPEKPELQTLCTSVGLLVRKQDQRGKEKDKTIPELKKQLLAAIYPQGKEPPHVVFKFGVANAHLNIGKGEEAV